MNSPVVKTVLYADDDYSYCKKAAQVLHNKGYEAIFCKTGEEAFQIISEDLPDIVIVDHDLPGINGEELYMKYLMSPHYSVDKNIPFISLSTNGNADKSQLYSLGFSGCLSKPFRSKDLVEFIEDALVSHQLKIEEVKFWEAIRESKVFLERVIESSLDAIITTDTKGVITYCNLAAEDLLGIEFNKVLDKRIDDFLVDGTSELLKINCILQKKGKISKYSTEIICGDKSTIHLNMAISVMKNGNGQAMGALAICKKVGLEEFNGYDNNKSERLAAILETAVAVNHEINNPLVPILGNAQFLLQNEKIQDEDIRRRLRLIVSNALRIREITQKLARISHPVNKEYLQGTMMLDIDGSM